MVIGFMAIPGVARADIDKPVWKNGNFWVYEGTGGTGSSGAVDHMKLRLDVVGTETINVEGTPYESYHTRLAINVTSGTLPLNSTGDAWFRTSDLALVKLTTTTTVTYFGQTLTHVVTVTMNPPQEMRWPLSAGATWTVYGDATVVLELTGQPPSTVHETFSGTARVGTAESRTVTAGRFDTNPVTLTAFFDGNTSKTYWSREAGNYVEQDAHDSSNRDLGSSQLTSYGYSPPSSLEGAGTILGLPWYVWIAVVGIAVAALVVLVVVRRRRPRMPVPVPPETPMAGGRASPEAPPMEPGSPNKPLPPAP
jgi:hypothetical protein